MVLTETQRRIRFLKQEVREGRLSRREFKAIRKREDLFVGAQVRPSVAAQVLGKQEGDITRIMVDEQKFAGKVVETPALAKEPTFVGVRPVSRQEQLLKDVPREREKARAALRPIEIGVEAERQQIVLTTPKTLEQEVEQLPVRQALPAVSAFQRVTEQQIIIEKQQLPKQIGEVRAFVPKGEAPTFLGIPEPQIPGLAKVQFELEKRAGIEEIKFIRAEEDIPLLSKEFLKSAGFQVAATPVRLLRTPIRTTVTAAGIALGLGALGAPGTAGVTFFTQEQIIGGSLAGLLAVETQQEIKRGGIGAKALGETVFFTGIAAVPTAVRGVTTKARRIIAERQFAQLETGATLKDVPFVLKEQIKGPQRDLFGRSLAEAKVKETIKELDVNKIGFGIERNPLRPTTERILSTGQVKLAEDVIVAVRPTGEVLPTKVVRGQPFIFEPRLQKFVEFVPKESQLITIPAKARRISPDVTILDTSTQTLLAEPQVSRSFRDITAPIQRIPKTRRGKAPSEPVRGVEVTTIDKTAIDFSIRPKQETFLETIEQPKAREILLPRPGVRGLFVSGLGFRTLIGKGLDVDAGLLLKQAPSQRLVPELREIINFQVDITGEVPREVTAEALRPAQAQVPAQALDIPFPGPGPALIFGGVIGGEVIDKPGKLPKVPAIPGLPKLPGFKAPKGDGREFDPFGQEFLFTPSFTAFTGKIFGEVPKEGELLTGFELRPIPERLRGLL